MKKSWIYVILSVFLLGSVGAYWLHQLEKQRSELASLLPAKPTLVEGKWPVAFVEALAESHAAALRNPDSPEILADLGRVYFANGFYDEASSVFDRLIKIDATNPKWHYYLSEISQSKGDNSEALEHLKKTAILAPQYAPVHLSIAELCFKQGDFDTAREHYQIRLNLIPGDPYAAIGLARIWLQLGHLSEAKQALEQLVELHPDFASALNLLAQLHEGKGERETAEILRQQGFQAGRFREADDDWMLEMNSWCYDPYRLVVIASTLEQTNRLEESIPFLERSIELLPDSGLAYEVLGRHYLYLNRLVEAEAILSKGLKADPNEPTLFFTLAKVMRRLRRPEQAISIATQGIEKHPALPAMFNELGICYDAAGRRADAIIAYSKALELDANHFESNLNLAKTLVRTGDTRGGDALLKKALDIQPWNVEALVFAIGREIDIGEMDSASQHLATLERIEPDSMQTRQLRAFWQLKKARALSREQRVDEAIEAFDAGIQADPTVADLYGNKGILLVQLERFEEALPALSKYRQLEPQKAIACFNLGYAQLRSGEQQEALKTLEAGLKLAHRQNDDNLSNKITQLLNRIKSR